MSGDDYSYNRPIHASPAVAQGSSPDRFADLKHEKLRPPQIELEFMEMQGALDSLLDIISTLTARLEPVLRPENSGLGVQEKLKEEAIAPLAETIRSKRFQVVKAGDFVYDIMRRLEI